MRRLILAYMMFALMVGVAYAAAKATPGEAMALAEKAAAYLEENGETKTFAEFNRKDGKFTHAKKDLYVFVFDMNGICLSHGSHALLIGKDLSQLKDPSGKFFVMDMVRVARTKGKGWVDYLWSNPTTRKIEGKQTYVLRVGPDRFIGCGIYK